MLIFVRSKLKSEDHRRKSAWDGSGGWRSVGGHVDFRQVQGEIRGHTLKIDLGRWRLAFGGAWWDEAENLIQATVDGGLERVKKWGG